MASERFLRRLALASAPLWIWALHFFLVYALVAVGCDAGPDGARRLAAAPLRGIALASGVAALGAIALGWHAAGRRCAPWGGRLGDVARHAGALLAAVGVAWGMLAALLLAPCAPS